MDDLDSFSQVVDRLRAKTRDPLSSRVSSVTAAILDVVEGDVTPAKVYASVVTTLEGILHQDFGEVESDTLLRSLYTEVALLKLLTVVVPHVAPSTLQATASLTSRVLRAVVTSSIALLADVNTERMLNTKDGLGATNHVLTMACGAAAELLRQLPHQTEDAVIRRLLNDTLMVLLQDSSRPKIQNAANEAMSELLLMKSPTCHPAIRNSTNKYINAMIDRYLKHPSQHSSCQSIIELMGFLNPALAAMDFTAIGGRIMTLLVDLLNKESVSTVSHASRAVKSRATTLNILTINSILSTILSLLESSDENGVQAIVNKLDAFAARVLASLVQVKSTLVFREGVAEQDLLESGQLIYGQVMLSASQRLLRGEATAEIGAKLLPLVLQQVTGLSRPLEDGGKSVGELLYVEISQLIRTNLQNLKECKTKLHESCSRECLQVLSSVIRYPFDPIYAPALQPLTLLLQQMIPGDFAAERTLSTLVDLRCRPEISDHVRSFVDGALVSLVEGIGVELFWTTIGFKELCCAPANKKSPFIKKYAWIFDVIKGSVLGSSRTRLSFFQREVLPLARNFDVMFAKGGPSSLMYRSQVVNLWSLFPVFCHFPSDTETTIPDLAPILIKAMNDGRYPELIYIVCKGLDLLFEGAIQRRDAFQELMEGDEAAFARAEIETLSQVSVKLLPSLFRLVDTLHERNGLKKDGGTMETHSLEWNDDASRIIAVTKCIAWSSRLAPKQHVGNLFSKVVQKILQTSQFRDDTSIRKMCSLLSLAQALVVSETLEESSIDLLYRSLKPLVRTDATPPRVQKRAYKVLCDMCRRYHSFMTDPDRLKEMLDLLSNTSVTSQIAARFMRLRCVTTVVEGFEHSERGANQGITTSLIGETLLCLKDSNAKTREEAYKLFLALCKFHGDTPHFMQVVAAAIGSNTSHMRSAAVTALARIVFEFSTKDDDVQIMIPALLKTVLMLSDDPSREVTKSMILFVRVAISMSTSTQLEPLLPDILGGLLKYHRGKDRFRSRIKIIIKKLVKIFGYDVLTPMVPPTDTRLLTHMRKLAERESRRKQSSSYQPTEETVGFDAMEDSDGEQDSDDGITLVTGMTRKSRFTRLTSRSRQTHQNGNSDAISFARSTKSSKGHGSIRIKNDADGEILNVSDLKTVTFADPSESDDDTSEDEVEFDASGKLVVRDVHDKVPMDIGGDTGSLDLLSGKRATTIQSGNLSRKSRGTTSEKDNKKVTTRPGQAYKAKRAGGDNKRKGQKYEPYAYMQLDGRSYTRKNRRQAVEKMGSIVERGRKRQKR